MSALIKNCKVKSIWLGSPYARAIIRTDGGSFSISPDELVQILNKAFSNVQLIAEDAKRSKNRRLRLPKRHEINDEGRVTTLKFRYLANSGEDEHAGD